MRHCYIQKDATEAAKEEWQVHKGPPNKIKNLNNGWTLALHHLMKILLKLLNSFQVHFWSPTRVTSLFSKFLLKRGREIPLLDTRNIPLLNLRNLSHCCLQSLHPFQKILGPQVSILQKPHRDLVYFLPLKNIAITATVNLFCHLLSWFTQQPMLSDSKLQYW